MCLFWPQLHHRDEWLARSDDYDSSYRLQCGMVQAIGLSIDWENWKADMGCCSETTFRGKRYFWTLRTKLSITIKIFTTMSEERLFTSVWRTCRKRAGNRNTSKRRLTRTGWCRWVATICVVKLALRVMSRCLNWLIWLRKIVSLIKMMWGGY